MWRILSACFFCLVVLSLPYSFADEPAYITVVGDKSYAPFEFLDADGKPQGIMVDFWNLWSQKTGVAVRIQLGEWADSIEAVRNGDADVISALFYSEERDAYLDFSRPFYTMTSHIFFHDSVYGLRGLQDLTGFKIGVVKGDYLESYIAKKMPDATFAQFNTFDDVVAAAVRGDVRAFVMDTPVGLFALAKYAQGRMFRQTKEPLIKNEVFVAVKEGNAALVELINRGIDAITDEEMCGIERRWIGLQLARNIPWRYVSFFVYGLIIIVSLVGIWIYFLGRNIRQRKRIEEQLRRSEERLQAFLMAIPDVLAVLSKQSINDVYSIFTDVFTSQRQLYGLPFDTHAEIKNEVTALSPAQIKGKSLAYVLPSQMAEEFQCVIDDVLETRQLRERDYTLLVDGEQRWFSARIAPLGKASVVWLDRDITNRKILEGQLEHNAYYDTLTDLPNRRLFIDVLMRSIARAERNREYCFAILFLDLDKFKIINDRLGHLAGDCFLIEVSLRLKKCVRVNDMAARLAGDEFTVFLDDVHIIDNAMVVARRIQKEFAKPMQLDNEEIMIQCSMGVLLYTKAHTTPDDILRDADRAMYNAKTSADRQIAVFNEPQDIE